MSVSLYYHPSHMAAQHSVESDSRVLRHALVVHNLPPPNDEHLGQITRVIVDGTQHVPLLPFWGSSCTLWYQFVRTRRCPTAVEISEAVYDRFTRP